MEVFDLLQGKSGFVTAAGSGIGRASAIKLAANGANVVVSDVNNIDGEETVTIIKNNGGNAAFFKCDVSQEEEVNALVKFTVDTFGKLDFAHNNAGVGAAVGPIADTTSDGFDMVMKVNLYGMYYAVKAEITEMLKTGGGSIVNTASAAGIEAVMNMVAYTSSKYAIVGLTKAVALEYAPYNIKVNAIAPGMTMTKAVEGFMESSPEQAELIKQGIPTRKISTPEDQANAVLYLVSDFSSNVTGTVLSVDGGFTAGKLS